MKNSTTPMKPILKKSKNAFDLLKNAQKKVLIVLPPSRKLLSSKSTTSNVSKKRKSDELHNFEENFVKPHNPCSFLQKEHELDDSNPFKDLLYSPKNTPSKIMEKQERKKTSLASNDFRLYKESKAEDGSEEFEVQEISYSKNLDEVLIETRSPIKKKVVIEKKSLNISSVSQQETKLLSNVNISNHHIGNYKSYSTNFKEEYIYSYLEIGLTKACLRKGVSIEVASKWIKKYKENGLLGLVDKRGLNSGPYNKYLDLYVLEEFKKKRQKGIMVNGLLLKALALQAPSAYKPDGFSASNGWLSKFLARNEIVKRKKTHQTQTVVEKLTKEMVNYLQTLQALKDSGEDLIYVNFDEVPIFFDLSADYTYNIKGQKDITSLSHSNSKTRATVTLGVASNGDVLPPLLTFIYKYASKGTRTFPKKYEILKNRTTPYMVRFTESGFNKDDVIIDYIDKIILGWKRKVEKDIVLLMDQAKCHLSEKVLSHLDKLRITYLVIPSGGTYLFQPLDVGLNKPFKDRLRKLYLSWLEKEVSVANVKILLCPEFEKIIDWTRKAVEDLEMSKIIESFQMTGVDGNIKEMFDEQQLNRKLHILLEGYLHDGENNEVEYMDNGDIIIQDIALGQELYIED